MALDEGSTISEKNRSALAACRLLDQWGLGVSGDTELQLALINQMETVAPPPVVVVVQSPAGMDERQARYVSERYGDLFGGAEFGQGRRRR